MLNSAPSKRMPADADDLRSYEPDYVTYNDVWLFLRRYAATIGIAFGIAMLLAAYKVYTSTPRYTAYAQILIDPSTIQVVRDANPAQGQSLDTAQVEGQIAVLRSESLAIAVINKLKLTEDPEFQPGPPSRMRQFIGFLTRGFTSPAMELPADQLDYAKQRVAIDGLQGNLDVRRVGPSYAISIGFTSVDPTKAAKIANAVAEAYIQEQLRAMSAAARQNSEWLEQRLQDLRNQLNISARQLEAFKAGRDYRMPQQRSDTAGGPQGLPAQGGVQQGVSGQTAGPVMTDPAIPGAKSVTLAELETINENNRKAYEAFQRSYTDAVQRQSFPVSNARVITSASRPLGRSEPRTMLIMAFGGMTGLLAGVAVAFLRNALDNTVHSARQLREHVGLPCLALIPRLDKDPEPQVLPPAVAGRMGRFGPPMPPEPPKQTDDFKVVIDAPFSPFTGSLKTLKHALSNADTRRPIRCVGITSAMPEEGKSTIVANLAALYSVATGRTLIIDADIHHSTASQHFAPDARVGLLEVVTGAAGYDQAIVLGQGLAPDILPIAATDAPVSYDLLASESMQVLLRSLRDHYDMVIVDLPPVNPIVDSVAIAALLDGVVLITEWGATPIDVVADVAGVLFTAQANVLGVALTKVDKSMATVRWRKNWGYGYYRSHTKRRDSSGSMDDSQA